jgi:hypothetical protein
MNQLISIALYFITGIICLIMAVKTIFSGRFLPFHEQASGKTWEELEKPLQTVILTIIRISGLGFLVVFLLLTIFPIVNYFVHDNFIRYSVPVISMIFCLGLFIFNFSLFRKTKAKTPWQGSLIALFILLISLIISVL